MDKRPLLNAKISIQDFNDFYWLKKELVVFCRAEGLPTNGKKLEVAQRIRLYLETGEKQISKPKLRPLDKTKFDWSKETLDIKTRITYNYQNTENVRQFFRDQIGARFKFNVQFMNWMKTNVGKNLGDAILVWQSISIEKKKNTRPKDIAPQFEYNRYLRDFLADNPASTRAVGIKLWKIKKSMRGDNVYQESDLDFLR